MSANIPGHVEEIQHEIGDKLRASKTAFIEIIPGPVGKEWAFTVTLPPDSPKISPIWYKGYAVTFDKGHKVLSKREVLPLI